MGKYCIETEASQEELAETLREEQPLGRAFTIEPWGVATDGLHRSRALALAQVADGHDEIARLNTELVARNHALAVRDDEKARILNIIRDALIEWECEGSDTARQLIDYGMKPFTRDVTVTVEVRARIEYSLGGLPEDVTDEQIERLFGDVVVEANDVDVASLEGDELWAQADIRDSDITRITVTDD